MNKNLWGWDSGTQVTLVFRWIENYYSKSQFAKWVFPYSAVWHKKNKSFVSSSFFSAYRSSLVGKFQKRHLNVKNKISFLTLYNKVLKTNQKQEGWRVRRLLLWPLRECAQCVFLPEAISSYLGETNHVPAVNASRPEEGLPTLLMKNNEAKKQKRGNEPKRKPRILILKSQREIQPVSK